MKETCEKLISLTKEALLTIRTLEDKNVTQRDLAWDLIAMGENMLLHYGENMSSGDRSGREKVLEMARVLWHPRP